MHADEAMLSVLDRRDHRWPAASCLAVVQCPVQPDRLRERAEDEPAAEIGLDDPVRRLCLAPKVPRRGDALGTVPRINLPLLPGSIGIGGGLGFGDQSAAV